MDCRRGAIGGTQGRIRASRPPRRAHPGRSTRCVGGDRAMAGRLAAVLVLALGVATTVNAQNASSAALASTGTPGAQSQTSSTAADHDTRPATTTFFGDTG